MRHDADDNEIVDSYSVQRRILINQPNILCLLFIPVASFVFRARRASLLVFLFLSSSIICQKNEEEFKCEDDLNI